MYNKNIFFPLLLMTSYLLSGCESKVTESAASGFVDSTTSEYKIKAQNDFEEKIALLQEKIERAKIAVILAQKSLNIKSIVPLSILDVISEANIKLQDELLNLKSKNISIYNEFKLNLNILTDDCKKINSHISSDSVYPMNQLNYALSSCYTIAEYLPVLKVNFLEKGIDFKVNNENFKRLFSLETIKDKILECHFAADSSGMTACYNIVFAVTTNEIWYADLQSIEKTYISVTAVNSKDGLVSYTGKIVIGANGAIESVKVEKTNDEEAE